MTADLGVVEPARPPRAGRRHPEQSTAQVFARDRRLEPDAPLVFLGPGEAESLRAAARAGDLVCPLGDCADNRFIVHGGTERRHHFAHRSGGGHGPETVAHHTAKHLIARWLRTLYPTAQVYPDTQEVETGQRPDVLLVLEDGTRVAYEVQFAALTAETWLARRNRYATEGIKNVWLFGGRTYDRAPRQPLHDDEVALHPVFEAVLAERHPMLLIDPLAETVALGEGEDVEELLTAAGVQPPTMWRPTATVTPRHPLSQACAARGVIELPGMRALLERTARAHAQWLDQLQRREELEQRAQAEHERRLAAWQERERQELARRADWERHERARREELARQREQQEREAAARGEATLRRRRELVQPQLDERTARWAPQRERIEAAVGPLPDVVDVPVPLNEVHITMAAPAQWRWTVLEVLAANHGFTVDHTGLSTLVPLHHGASRYDAVPLVEDYLCHLRAAGWVWFWGAHGPRRGEAVRVLAALGVAPRRARAKALRIVGGTRVSGPDPSGRRYQDQRDTLLDPVERGRLVGIDALQASHELALAEDSVRTARAALSREARPSGGSPQAEPGGPPDLRAVHLALPDAADWCAARTWPSWDLLPPRLHEAARLTFYVLATVYRDQPQPDLRLGDCTPDDAEQILQALHRSGFIAHGAAGWQVTYGGQV